MSDAAKPSMFDAMRAMVRKVPRGKVTTYGDVAVAAGFPTGSRQAAWALKKFDPRLPWHRVIGKGGKILLRGEGGVEQVQRLEAEGIVVRGARVDLAVYGFDFGRGRKKRSGRRRNGAPEAS